MTELFDYKKPKIEIVQAPSRAQLRMLHVLTGATLIFRRSPFQGFEIRNLKTEVDESWRFHQVTARIIVDRGWVELKGFNPKRGEYQITPAGSALTEELCLCRMSNITHRAEETMENLAGRLLCRACGHRVHCVSRKPMKHAGSRLHWKYGPVCDEHWRKIG